jgi:hypothetical protein
VGILIIKGKRKGKVTIMKLLGYNGFVKITNKAGGSISMGKFSLKHGRSKDINPMNFSDSTVKSLDIFLAKGVIEVTPIDNVEVAEREDTNVVKKETIKNEKGEKNEHSVFDPATAKKERAIQVNSVEDNSNAIEISFTEVDKAEAMDFLEQHWKKIEKELVNYRSIKRLTYMLSVANEIGMNGNKKYELIEDRIAELKK